MVWRLKISITLSLLICSVFVFIALNGCSRKFYKEDADKEVYKILENKWHDDFGEMTNYKVNDTTPNDVEIAQMVPSSGVINLRQAVALATKYNRDYQSQKESLYLSALDLTGTRYQYAIRWFGTIDGTYTDDKSNGDDVTVESSSGADTSQLLLGGILFNAGIAIDWMRFLTGDPRNALSSVLNSDITIPLLGSGAGKQAKERLTQAERNVLYSIRTFNRYRQTFVVSIISDYYRVLLQKERVVIAEASYKRLIDSTNQLRMQVEVGQSAPAEADEAEQKLLTAENNLVSTRQNYEQTLDSFKIRLAIPTDANIVLDQNDLLVLEQSGVGRPGYSEQEAIEMALNRRLDLANTKDGLEDSQRQLELAAEGLGVQLNLVGSVDVSSPRNETDFQNLQFHRGVYELGFEADLPIDRKNERNAYREALISLQRQQRGYDNDVERIKLDIRQAYRNLIETAETYRIQKVGLRLAERRVEEQKLRLQYGLTTIRLLLQTEDDLVSAQNNVSGALVDHTISKLNFFRDTGVLQVRPDGMWEQSAQ